MINIHIKYCLLVIILSLTTSGYLTGQSMAEKGQALYFSKRYDEAKNVLESVQKNSSDYSVAQYYLGRIAYDKKKYDDASDYFETATEANPNNGDYFNWLGDAYSAIGSDASFFKQMSVGPKALRAWEKAAKLDSTQTMH